MPAPKVAAKLRPLLVPIDSIETDPDNVRMHDQSGLQALARSLESFGQQKPVVVRQGRVIAGNGTLVAARDHLKWTKIAAVEFKGSEPEAKAYALADNRTAELSVWDDEKLAANLEALTDFKPVDLGFDDAAVEQITEDPFAGAPEDPKPAVKPLDTDKGPMSHVKMLQLFLDEEHKGFIENVRALGGRLGTGTITDAVIAAVDGQYKEHCGG